MAVAGVNAGERYGTGRLYSRATHFACVHGLLIAKLA